MKINSNIQAQIANSVLKANESKYAKATEKLSSGYKINHAEDAPAGMAITNRMHAQLAALNKATQNASNGISVIQTAEGALSEIQDMVQRMNELSVKAANGTMTEADRNAIQKEIDQLTKEVERIANDTEYNTQNLLGGEQALKGYTDKSSSSVLHYDIDFPQGEYSFDYATGNLTPKPGTNTDALPDGTVPEYDEEGGFWTITTPKGAQAKIECDKNSSDGSANIELKGVGGMKIQVGASEGQEIQLVIPTISLKNMGIEDIDCTTEEGAKKAMDQVQNALSFISSARSSLGAYQNRLETTVETLNISVENLTQSYSTIKDVDMADEMVNYTTLQVLVQAGTSMLTQANEQPQQALQLLQ